VADVLQMAFYTREFVFQVLVSSVDGRWHHYQGVVTIYIKPSVTDSCDAANSLLPVGPRTRVR
jgi:hypothetical protein